ncbi:MAG: class I SAM-dependent methyltransferase [Chlamydiales bacterium]|nr:class I SAM-dependent methyltransferase [Chlamydiales bacterium]
MVTEYYQDLEFKAIDKALLGEYWFSSPYRIAKRYYLELGEDPYVYGETPFETFMQIGHALKLKPQDTLLELGCGRGRGAFFLNHFFESKVVAIEQIPEFIERAQRVQKNHSLRRIEFRCQDMLKCCFDGATAVFLAGTCLQEDVIERLTRKLSQYNLRIATISYPLKGFKVSQELEIAMPWGTTSAFIHEG